MGQQTGSPPNGNPPDAGDNFRFGLSKWVVVYAFWVIGVLGVAALVVVCLIGTRRLSDNLFSDVKDILGLLLPLIGTWVGTVLAFYFTRENYEAAARSTSALVQQFTPDQKLQSVAVQDAMILIAQATTLTTTGDGGQIKLQTDILALLESKKVERLPVLDEQGTIRYIVHRSTVDRFIVKSASAAVPPKPIADLTLADILADADFKTLLTSFGTLGGTATLADAKTIMDGSQKCGDVFVTTDGRPPSKVLGWVTDVIVRQQSTV